MVPDRALKETVLTLTGADGAVFDIVVFTDDTYGIRRNGEPTSDCPPTLKGCLERLHRLIHSDDGRNS